MRRLLFIISFFFTACSLNLPQTLPSNIISPVNIEKNGKQITVYLEQNQDSYSVLGIHPLSGREFLVKVRAGKMVEEEYGFIFSKSEVETILKEVFAVGEH